MTVTVLFFASAREAAGAERTQLEIQAPLTAAGLLDLLCGRHPALVPHRGSMRLAVNRRYVELDHVVEGGDEVALIPPVAGG